MTVKSRTKSPLKDNPLRNPGQSLDEEINRLVDDQISMWITFIVFSIVLAGLEWWRWYTNPPFTPWIYTILALVVTAVGIWKLRKFRRKLAKLNG